MGRVRRHTIIGNSAAGLSAIKAIRKSGDTRPITLISAEDCNAYSPVLTTYYIGGQIEKKGLFLVGRGFYRKHGVQTMFGRRVQTIDPIERRLVLDDRTRLDYDQLLIATGASARTLENVDPEATAYVSNLRTVDDADKIRTIGRRAKEVVVTGAGLVSLQTVKAILGRGIKITVVVGSDQVLSQQMDRESAFIIQEKLEAEGVEILFGRRVERVYRQGDRAHVVTSYGETLPADLVVVGKGVRPNTDLAGETSIKVNYGILVDEQMRTSRQNVFAAGDVAEGKNDLTGDTNVIATWFNACAQGEIAGLNMAGRPARRQGQFQENITTILGVAVASIGQSNPEYGQYQEVRYVDYRRSEIRKLFFLDSRVVGALLVGRIEDAGVIKHCIASGMDLSPWKDHLATAPLDFGRILCGGESHWPHLNN